MNHILQRTEAFSIYLYIYIQLNIYLSIYLFIYYVCVQVLAGTEAFLECVANGNPQPTISWLKVI